MQLPPPDAILSNVYKAFEECNPIKRFQNKHNTKHFQNKFLKSTKKHIQNKVSKHNSKAFTLAEVLIALVIIGVVAAITVPSILQNTQRNEIVSKVKKADSVLKQSLYKIAMNEGLPVGDFSSMSEDDFFNAFTKTVNVSKLCTNGKLGCFTTNNFKYLNGGTSPYNFNRTNSLVTTDGIAYGWNRKSENGNEDYCAGKGLTSEDKENCIGRFIVDINGSSPPNHYGYDVFFWTIVNKKGIVATGSGDNSADCNRTSKGLNCAAKVLREGKISYL